MEEITNVDSVDTTDNVNAEDISNATARQQLELIPKITYIGPKQFAKIVVGVKTEYKFVAGEKFTVQPKTFEDFYQILEGNLGLFALEEDPKTVKVQMNRSRILKTHVEEEKLVEVRAEENYKASTTKESVEAKKEARHAVLVAEYIASEKHKIAMGKIDELPIDMDKKAEEFATNEVTKEFAEVKEEVKKEVVPTPDTSGAEDNYDPELPSSPSEGGSATGNPTVSEPETEVKINE